MDSILKKLFFLLVSVSFYLVSNHAYAQYDTAYYVNFEQKLTGRFYFSRKFTALQIKNPTKDYTLNYFPNTSLNMGVGATYHWATLNLAYGFAFLNPERGRGKTKYLDLQLHSYGRKIVLDGFGQFYKGFYLGEKQYSVDNNTFYRRPDLRVNLIGTSAQYVVNHKKFSYRASFLQNEWQKKSAGTFLIGLETYLGWIKADSSIVPGSIAQNEREILPKKINFFELGPNVGYAYTLVIHKYFFITGSASLSLDFGRSVLRDDVNKEKTSGFSPNTFLRFFGGYNSGRWAINLVYITDRVRLVSSQSDKNIFLNTGNYRLNFTYRFKLSRKARKALNIVDEVKN
jgi:hypothetical protein